MVELRYSDGVVSVKVSVKVSGKLSDEDYRTLASLAHQGLVLQFCYASHQGFIVAAKQAAEVALAAVTKLDRLNCGIASLLFF